MTITRISKAIACLSSAIEVDCVYKFQQIDKNHNKNVCRKALVPLIQCQQHEREEPLHKLMSVPVGLIT